MYVDDWFANRTSPFTESSTIVNFSHFPHICELQPLSTHHSASSLLFADWKQDVTFSAQRLKSSTAFASFAPFDLHSDALWPGLWQWLHLYFKNFCFELVLCSLTSSLLSSSCLFIQDFFQVFHGFAVMASDVLSRELCFLASFSSGIFTRNVSGSADCLSTLSHSENFHTKGVGYAIT